MGGRKITKKALTHKTGPTHPNSRRAMQLQRIDHRTNKLVHAKKVRQRGSDQKVERLVDLIMLLPPDLAFVPDLAYLHAFLQSSFLERHTEEVERLTAQHRAGRPTPMELIRLRHRIAQERKEYEGGMDIPDLMSEANVKLLRDWNGDPNALGLFRMVRVSGTDKGQYLITQKGSHISLQTDLEQKKAQSALSKKAEEERGIAMES